MIKTPAIEGKETADVFLVRHGLSEFNYRDLLLKKGGGDITQQLKDLKKNPDVCDANLHAIGVH